MAASTRRDLFLQVSGNVDNLAAAMKAGRSVLTQFGAAANDTTEEVQKAFAKMGGGSVEQTARSIDAAYAKTFANIRANAMKAAEAPTPKMAAQVVNAAGADQAATAAEAQAASLALVADAAERAAAANQGDAAAAKVYAIAARAAAVGAEEQAAALRSQADILASVRGQLGAAADAEDEVSRSHNRLGASGMIAEHVVRSFSDSMTAGQSPVRAFAMELPRITEAMQFLAMETNATEGAMGKFASFMGGGWGLGLTLGLSLLAPLVAELFEGGKASDEMKGKAVSLVDALTDEALSTDQARKALEAFNAEKKRARDADAESTQATLDAAKAKLQEAIATRKALQAEADKMLTERNYDPNGGMQGQVGAARGYQAGADKQAGYIAADQQTVREIEIDQAKDAAKAAADPIEAIRLKYKQLADAAAAAAANNDKLAASLKGTLSGYAREEAAEIKAEQARLAAQRRETSDNRQVGRQIDLSQAEDIVRDIGGTVTSSYRSTAKQSQLYAAYLNGTGSLAAKPGTSLHERGQALDVAKTAGISLGALKKAFEDAGVHLTEALDEGNHYHVGFGPKGGRGPSADTLARRQQAVVVRGANTDRAFQVELAQAQLGLARAGMGAALDPDRAGAIDRGEMYAGLDQKKKELADSVTAKRLTQAQADQLADIDAQTEELDEINSLTKQRLDDIAKQTDAEQQQLSNGLALLQLQGDLATTTKQRRDIALRMLADEEARSRIPLQAIVDHPELHTPDEVKKAQAGLVQVDAEHPLRVAAINKQDADPMQAYGQQLQAKVGDLGDAAKGLEVDGLNSFEDGLEGIIDKSETASQAVKKMVTSMIADIARLAVERGIFMLLGLKDGGQVASVASPTSAYADGGLPGFATGASPSVINGLIRGPGTGRSDSILALVGGTKPIKISNGEGIVNERAVKNYWPVIDAMNRGTFPKFADGGLVSPDRIFMRKLPSASSIARTAPAGSPITFDLRGAVMTQDLLDQMNTISAKHSQAAIIGGAKQAAEDRHDDAYSAIPQ